MLTARSLHTAISVRRNPRNEAFWVVAMALGEGDSSDIAPPSHGPKNLCSRIWHLAVAFLYLSLTIVALVSVLVFALFIKSLEKNAFPYNEDTTGVLGRCILFGGLFEIPQQDPPVYLLRWSSGTLGASCDFNVWGEAAVSIAAALLCVASVVKALVGVRA